jgi:hypothetical protein
LRELQSVLDELLYDWSSIYSISGYAFYSSTASRFGMSLEKSAALFNSSILREVR